MANGRALFFDDDDDGDDETWPTSNAPTCCCACVCVCVVAMAVFGSVEEKRDEPVAKNVRNTCRNGRQTGREWRRRCRTRKNEGPRRATLDAIGRCFWPFFFLFFFFGGGGGSFLPDTKLGNPLGDLASSRRRPLVDAGSQWPTSTLLIDLLTHRRFRRQITLGFRFFFGLG